MNITRDEMTRRGSGIGTAGKIAGFLAGASLLILAGCGAEETEDAAAAGETSAVSAAFVSEANAQTNETGATAAADAPEPDGSVDVAALMEEGPLPDVVIGDPDAPVTIIEYASMTCGHCANFHENTLPTIMENYIETGQAKLIVREFPFDPRALAAFMLARCAPNENRTEMIDVLFDQQAEWARAENASEALLQIARMAGFTQESFAACLNDTELQENIIEIQQRAASEFGVEATPTFFVNGDKYSGALPPDQMSAVIEAHL